jgi:hypothetical protein
MTNPRFNELKKLMEKASARGKKLPRKAIRPRLGTKGTNFAEAKMSLIKKITERDSPNSHKAAQILKIFFEAHKGNVSPPERDHQILTNIVNKIIKAEKQKQSVSLNLNQKNVLAKYYQMAK